MQTNVKLIIYIVGSLLLMESLMMLLPAIVSAIYDEPEYLQFIYSAVITSVVGGAMALFARNHGRHISKQDSFIIVTMVWLFVSLFGVLPFILTGTFDNFIDAFFEAMSGFTTTGSTMLRDCAHSLKGILFWRCFTQWIGGLGVIALSIVILPAFGMGNTQMFSAETSVSRFERIHPKVKEIAKFMWIIYLVLTILQVVLLMLGDMNFFESLCHSFSSISTGGFSVYNESIGYYESAYIEYVVMVFMFLGGVNFTMYYMLLKRKFDRIIGDDELRVFLFIIFIVSLILATINYTDDKYWSLENCLRDSFFQVISIMTGTGFYTCDYMSWSSPTLVFLALLLVCGASTGSTCGGIKLMRHVVVFRSIIGELKRATHPTAVVPVRYNGKGVGREEVHAIMVFVLLYFFILLVGLIIMGILGYGLDDSFGLIANSLGNIGTGIGDYGPSGSLCDLDPIAKLTMTILMLIGRLEIYTVILLFTRGFWKR